MQKISIVAAMSENQVIGAQNKLPWSLPFDWENALRIVAGKPCIMGRKSYESEDMIYSDRLNVVLCTKPIHHLPAGFIQAYHLDQAFEMLKKEPEIIVFGGSRVFAESWPRVNYLYLTIVHHHFKGDTFFPNIDWPSWKMVQSKRHEIDDRHAYPFSLNEYRRTSASPK
ncbi:MAG: dihydrofolate reductase [Bacteroidota bacterium]